MKFLHLLIVCVLGYIPLQIHAYSLESVLEKKNSRTPEEMVAELDALPEAKKSAVFTEIGNIVGISSTDAQEILRSGNYQTRSCQKDEILDTAGYDPKDGVMKYAPRFCRNETLILIEGNVVASAGCGNPSKGQYKKIVAIAPVVVPEKTQTKKECFLVEDYYETAHQSFDTGHSHHNTWDHFWNQGIYALGSNGTMDYPIIISGGEKRVCREVPSQ